MVKVANYLHRPVSTESAITKKFEKFTPITKVEEQKDGTLLVHGLFTAQRPDLVDEVCDYEKSKPYYQTLAKVTEAATAKVDGMQVSLFPVREMHDKIAAGAGREIFYDDEAKTITGTVHVVFGESIKKVKAGVLRAFSQGGTVVGEMVKDPDFPGCMRYVANPSEISLVDAPCLPEAMIDSIKEATLTYVKSNGSTLIKKLGTAIDTENEPLDSSKDEDRIRRIFNEEFVKANTKTKRVAGEDLTAAAFAFVGDKEDTSTWKLPIKFSTEEKSKAHVRNALARFEQTNGIPEGEKAKVKARLKSAAKEHGIDVADESEKIAKSLATFKDFGKGLCTVASFAEAVDHVAWIRESVTWEREMEGDASTAPEEFTQLLEDMIACLRNMVEEETDELLAAAGGNKGAKAMTIEEAEKELAKAKDHMKSAMKSLTKAKDHNEKMSENHADMCKSRDDLTPLMGEHVDMLGDALTKAKGTEAAPMIEKAIAHHGKMMKMRDKTTKMCKSHDVMHDAHSDELDNAIESVKSAMEASDQAKSAPEPTVTKNEPSAEMKDLVDMFKAQSKQLDTLATAIAKMKEVPVVDPAPKPTVVDPLQELKDLFKAQSEKVEELTKSFSELDPTKRVKAFLIPRGGDGATDNSAAGSPSEDLSNTGF